MKRQATLATAILALFFGVGLLRPGLKASDQTATQQPRKVVTAVAEDFRGSSKVLYFSEDDNGVRTPLTEGEVSREAHYSVMSAQGVQTVGVKKLAVILTNFTDDPRQPMTFAEVQEAVFGTGPDSLASRYSRNSYGQLTLVGRTGTSDVVQ